MPPDGETPDQPDQQQPGGPQEEPPGEWPAGTKEDQEGKQVLTEH